MQDADVGVERRGQRRDVVGIGSDHHGAVAVGEMRGSNSHAGVDDIGGAGACAEPAASASCHAVQSNFVAMRQCSREQCLSAPTAPCLRNDAGRHCNDVARVGRCSQPRPQRPVVAVERDERPRVEHQSGQWPNSARARASSSSVNAPCSASQSATTSRKPRETSRRRAASASHADVFCSSCAAASLTAAARAVSSEMVSRSVAMPEIIHLHNHGQHAITRRLGTRRGLGEDGGEGVGGPLEELLGEDADGDGHCYGEGDGCDGGAGEASPAGAAGAR